MVFVNEWNETTPAGTETPRLGDNRIREFKSAIRERLEVEHYFYDDETGHTDVGQHKAITITDALKSRGISLVSTSIVTETFAGADSSIGFYLEKKVALGVAGNNMGYAAVVRADDSSTVPIGIYSSSSIKTGEAGIAYGGMFYAGHEDAGGLVAAYSVWANAYNSLLACGFFASATSSATGVAYGLKAQVAGGGDTNWGTHVTVSGAAQYDYGYYAEVIGANTDLLAAGVYAIVQGDSPNSCAVFGQSMATGIDSFAGCFQNDAATTNQAVGCFGQSIGAGVLNYGIKGLAYGASNNYGGFFEATDNGGAGNINYGVYGSSLGAGNVNYGVYGKAENGVTNWAGFFEGDAYSSRHIIGTGGASGGFDNANLIVLHNGAFITSLNTIGAAITALSVPAVPNLQALFVGANQAEDGITYGVYSNTIISKATNDYTGYGIASYISGHHDNGSFPRNIAIYGNATGGFESIGVCGEAHDTSGSNSYNIGVKGIGYTRTSTANGIAIKAEAYANAAGDTAGRYAIQASIEGRGHSGPNYGVWISVPLGGTNNYGLYISAHGASGSNYSLYGRSGQMLNLDTYSNNVGAVRTMMINSSGLFGVNTSSLRYKENIEDMEDVSWIYELRPVSYNRKDDEFKRLEYGLIAEEVMNVCPVFVELDKEGNPESIEYYRIVPVLLKAIQELKKEIEELKSGK